MIYYIYEREKKETNAGGKAPADVNEVCKRLGYVPVKFPHRVPATDSFFKKINLSIELIISWATLFLKTKSDDTVIYQHPMSGMPISVKCLELLAKKVTIITIIHDLNFLRTGDMRYGYYDRKVVEISSAVVSHNARMSTYIKEKVANTKIVNLEIFDYLYDGDLNSSDKNKTICIAGNMSKNKSKYIYELPKIQNVKFRLYGPNFSGINADNITYEGVYPADELPSKLKGTFGLVWDGESVEDCIGDFGDYTKYNNPHKASLYLACNLPIIVWTKAAIADFVIENKVGFTVGSLYEIEERLKEINDEEISLMQHNAAKIGILLRSGCFTEKALQECIKIENA